MASQQVLSDLTAAIVEPPRLQEEEQQAWQGEPEEKQARVRQQKQQWRQQRQGEEEAEEAKHLAARAAAEVAVRTVADQFTIYVRVGYEK